MSNVNTNEVQKNQTSGDETTTFKDPSGQFQFTVKNTFLKIVPNPETLDPVVLIKDHKMPEYWHNPVAPAVVRLDMDQNDPDSCEYWINGRMIDDPEVIAKMKHNTQFSDKFNTLLNSKM